MIEYDKNRLLGILNGIPIVGKDPDMIIPRNNNIKGLLKLCKELSKDRATCWSK